ncbi:Aste57867_15478 [Aphanomyces stellatus]|uniref:Aste57867_15478 protein n=1 Tax=Aphanomyces stellatus TaxID=120398 RepID=A0A485L480_9STRA|nr:hypothetical protein As57867_015422 [Aphanomyces stellatus]VFT92280.1 Aste57867_15478 [Aphanomyces stellatus]
MLATLRTAFVAAASVLSVSASEWGGQDLWIYSSAWYGEQCSCMCADVCWHPTPYMIEHLVTARLFAVYNNATPTMTFMADGTPQLLAASSTCAKKPALFSKPAIDAVGRAKLIQYFPFEFTKNANAMWDATYAKPNQVVPLFDQPCAGAMEQEFLGAAVQIAKYIGTPAVFTNNIGKTIPKQDIVDAFAALGLDAVLVCRGDALFEVFTCWGKNEPFQYQSDAADQRFGPAMPIACPPGVVATGNCKNETVSITKFVIRNTTSIA